jgi:hypothetical protein
VRIDLVGTTADFRRPGPQHPLLLITCPAKIAERRVESAKLG